MTAPGAAEPALYRERGWVAPLTPLPAGLLAPAAAAAERLRRERPWQELLSGVHNPFGQHACLGEAWQFLDIAESAAVLDPLESLIGPDIVFWDSELFLDAGAIFWAEAEHWPVEPLAGAVVLLTLATGAMVIADITRLAAVGAALPLGTDAIYLLRYMPASAHFNRDDGFAANRRAAEARPLVNYAKRPLWLVRGRDRGANDFAMGFMTPAACWGAAPELPPETMAAIADPAGKGG